MHPNTAKDSVLTLLKCGHVSTICMSESVGHMHSFYNTPLQPHPFSGEPSLCTGVSRQVLMEDIAYPQTLRAALIKIQQSLDLTETQTLSPESGPFDPSTLNGHVVVVSCRINKSAARGSTF